MTSFTACGPSFAAWYFNSPFFSPLNEPATPTFTPELISEMIAIARVTGRVSNKGWWLIHCLLRETKSNVSMMMKWINLWEKPPLAEYTGRRRDSSSWSSSSSVGLTALDHESPNHPLRRRTLSKTPHPSCMQLLHTARENGEDFDRTVSLLRALGWPVRATTAEIMIA